MIDALVTVIDRLIQLKDYRDRRLQDTFHQILEPAFDDLMLVHRDYMEMFEKTRSFLPPHPGNEDKTLPEYHKKMSEAAKYLRHQRLEFEPIRIKLKALSHELSQEDLGEKIRIFVDDVIKYFPDGTLRAQQSSASKDLLEKIEYWNNDENVSVRTENIEDTIPWEIVSRIHSLQTSHNEKWSHVCNSFAKLKVYVLTRP